MKLKLIASFLLALIPELCAADINPPTPTEADNKDFAMKQLGKLPVFFIENQGQLPKEVAYYFKGKDSVYFTNNGVVFQKTGARGQGNHPSLVVTEVDSSGRPSPLERDGSDPLAENPPCFKGGKQGLMTQMLAYKLEFVGASPTAPIAKNELEGRVNYLIGNDPSMWHTDVPTYQEIVYPGLYQKTGAREITHFPSEAYPSCLRADTHRQAGGCPCP